MRHFVWVSPLHTDVMFELQNDHFLKSRCEKSVSWRQIMTEWKRVTHTRLLCSSKSTNQCTIKGYLFPSQHIIVPTKWRQTFTLSPIKNVIHNYKQRPECPEGRPCLVQLNEDVRIFTCYIMWDRASGCYRPGLTWHNTSSFYYWNEKQIWCWIPSKKLQWSCFPILCLFCFSFRHFKAKADI